MSNFIKKYEDNKDEVSYIAELTKTISDNKPNVGDCYLFLSGLDTEAEKIKKLLNNENSRLFENYFKYTTHSRETEIKDNLILELETITPLLYRLTKENSSIPNILNIQNLGCQLWWDNAPVEFKYEPWNPKPFYLTFKNGRSIHCTGRDISLCSELSSNIQLSIAYSIAKTLDFTLNLNTVNYDASLNIYNYLPIISWEYNEELSDVYDLLKMQKYEVKQYSILNTDIVYNVDTFEFEFNNTPLPKNEVLNLLLIKTLSRQLN